jgi:pyridoxamine 5'-phosphate oxidase
MINDLAAILDEVWTCLMSGAYPGQHRSPFTLLQLATIGLDSTPKVRTVISRSADRERGQLSFHTDARSEKVAEIEQDSHAAVVAGDWNAGLQIRLEGTAHVVSDRDERLAVWNSSRPGTLTLYKAPFPPGTSLNSPSDAASRSPQSIASALEGFEHFALVDFVVQHIDYLNVSGTMHRRAQFSLRQKIWSGHWVAP